MASLLSNPLRSFSASTSQAELIDPKSLGREFEDENGNVYKLVQATGVIAANSVAKYADTEADGYSVEEGEAAKAPAGIAMATVADGDYFFIQVAGTCTPTMASAPTAEDLCFVVASGEVESAAAGAITAAQLSAKLGVALSATVVKLQGLR